MRREAFDQLDLQLFVAEHGQWELVDRRELDQKSYADLLTELHGEVCTANTGAAARAAAARARWDRPVT